MANKHNTDHSLSGEELLFYREHGFLVRQGVFSAGELGLLRDAVEEAVDLAYGQIAAGTTYYLDGKRFVDIGTMTVQFEHQENSEVIRVIEPAHHLHPALETLVEDRRLVDPVRQIIGTDAISVWTNKLNLKRAREGSGFGWHQDSPYWIHDSQHVDLLPNVYLAFDDATKQNGCLKVIDRSHLKGCLPGRSDGSQLGGFFTDPGSFNEADQVLMEAPAGSLVFFDPHSIHGSAPNYSDQARRAMVLTYQPAGLPMLKTGQVRDIPGEIQN